MTVKDHMYDAPIVDLKWHPGGLGGRAGGHVISTDKHIVKVGARLAAIGRQRRQWRAFEAGVTLSGHCGCGIGSLPSFTSKPESLRHYL